MEGTRSIVIGTNGVAIGVLSAGEGLPLLLVHGGMGQIERWAPVWNLLAKSWHVTAMDRRGRGSSGDGASYCLDDEFGDVTSVASVLAGEAGAPIDVFGHSYGATCTLGAAAQGAPFRRIVIYEPPGPETVSADWIDRVSSMVAAGKPGRAMESFLTEIIGLSDSEVEELEAAPLDYDILATLSHTVSREANGLLTVDIPTLALKITAPVLVLLGERSPQWAQDISRRTAEALFDSTLVVLPDVGHEAIDVAPERLVQELQRHLG